MVDAIHSVRDLRKECAEGTNLRVIAPGNTAPFKMSQWWRATGNTVFDLTGNRFESHTSRSKDERVIA